MKRIISAILSVVMLSSLFGVVPVSAAANQVTFFDMEAKALPSDYMLLKPESSLFGTEALYGKNDDAYLSMSVKGEYIDHRVSDGVVPFSAGSTILFSADFAMSNTDNLPTVQFAAYRSNKADRTVNVYYSPSDANYTKKITPGAWHNISIALKMDNFGINEYNKVSVWVDGVLSHETTYQLVQPTNGNYGLVRVSNPADGNTLYLDNYSVSIYPAGETPEIGKTISSDVYEIDEVTKTITIDDEELTAGEFKNAVKNAVVVYNNGGIASDSASLSDCSVYAMVKDSNGYMYYSRYKLIMPESTSRGFLWDVSDRKYPYNGANTSSVAPGFTTAVYGKSTEDVSLEQKGTGLFQIQDITSSEGITEGDRIVFSFDAAFSDLSGANAYFFNLVPTENKNVFYNGGAKQNYGVALSDGVINFYGNATNEKLEAEKWYSFKLVYDVLPGAASARVSLYIDGRKITSDVMSVTTPISSVYYLRFSNGSGNAAYYDNIGLDISEYTRTFEDEVSFDFADDELSPLFDASNATEEAAYGVYKRQTSDKSIKITDGYVDFMPTHEIIAGDVALYSFDFAVDSLGSGEADYAFPILFNYEKVPPMGISNSICVQNGRLIFFNLDKGITIEEKKWYNVVLKMDFTGNGTAMNVTANVNGIPVELGSLSIADTVNSIGALRFDNIKGNALYVDDVSFGVFGESKDPEVLSVPNITAADNEGKKLIDNNNKMIYITGKDNITVGEFISHINSDNVSVIRADGTSADNDDLLAECKVYAVEKGIYHTKYTVNNKKEYYCKYADFEDETANVKAVNEAYTEVKFEAVNGDDTYGKSLILAGNGERTESNYTPILEYNFAHSGAGVFTIEFMLNVTGNNASYQLQVRNSGDKTSYLPVILNSDGTISSYDSDLVTGRIWNRDEWLPVMVTVYPKAKKYDLYIDGEFVGCGGGSNLSSLNQVRIIQNYAAGSSVSDIMAVDNVRIYAGAPELYYTEFYKDGELTSDAKNADSVMVQVTNQREAVAVLAVYDEKYEKLIKVSIGKKAKLDNIADSDNLTLFIWDNLADSMNPVIEPKTFKGDDNIVLAADCDVAGAINDGMVFQRNEPIVIWGTAEALDGTYVKVSLGGNTAYGVVDGGKWEATLPAMEANSAVQTLTVTTRYETKTFNDILIGDVYMVAGQSNAALPMSSTSDYNTYLEKISEDDNIRCVIQKATSSTTKYYSPLCWSDVKRENPYPTNIWQAVEETNLGSVPSIGFYTAASLRESGVDVPIGIISVAHSGVELAQMVSAEVASKNGIEASRSYNALAAPFEKLKLCGFLWYQGENDSKNQAKIDRYGKLFSDYIDYIREIRNQPDIKVFSMQLSSHDPVSLSSWNVPGMRAAQYEYSKNIEGLYLIPTHDKGPKATDPDFAHPEYKLDIGKRIAALAEAVIYNKKDIADVAAPAPSGIAYDETGVTITFANTVDGLTLSTGEAPVGFELTKDGVAYEATARIIDANTIRIEGVENPDGVRYAFYHAAAPALANIVNSNGLPCPTFVEAKAGSGYDSADIRDIPALNVGYLVQ